MNARYLVVVLTMCTAGCGYAIKTTSDYDTRVDFSNYATFFTLKGNSSGDPKVDNRLISAVGTALTGKGLVEVPEGEGQAVVVVNTATETNHTYQTFYDGWGGWHSAGPESSRGFIEDYKLGTVVVTIFDAETKRAIWRGFATDALLDSPKQNAKATEKAVARMFTTFPATARPQAVASASSVGNEPPSIIFSTEPSRLILIHGDPIYRPVPGTELQRIVNTTPLIVRNGAGVFYLKILDGWMETYSFEGGWSPSGVTPEGGDAALQQALASKTVDLLDGVDPKNPAATGSVTNGDAPAIFISTTPARLIVTDGPMVFAPLEGTSLQYVVNTSADVFREPTDQELYLLTSGRWFRSWKTEGPWQLVASSELPADFARIPDGSPKARVKASIAGTVEAR